jgi:hypothetical protein
LYSNTIGGIRILINNKVMVSEYVTAGNSIGCILPILEGQTISYQAWDGGTNQDRWCFFIPPKLVQKLPPIIVEGNGSYSTDEIKTNDVWLNGKPIYKKTVFHGDYTMNTGTTTFMSNVFPSNTYTENVIKLEFYGWLPNDNNTHISGVNSYTNAPATWTIDMYYRQTPNRIDIERGGTSILFKDFTVTLFYTKTSD